MKYYTWEEIREKIESETDTQDEDFVRPEEMLAYANEAIDEAEAEIHGIYEDYFLSYVDYPIAPPSPEDEVGQNWSGVLMPDDIYANKIRKVIFYAGGVGTTQWYPINRLKDDEKFEAKAAAESSTGDRGYKYMIVNKTAGSPLITWVPTISETGTVRVWYLRNANRLTGASSDICDIPEFVRFIFSYMKVKIYEKEGHPGLDDANMKLERDRAKMVSTLTEMVPDADNNIEADTSAYDDMN